MSKIEYTLTIFSYICPIRLVFNDYLMMSR